MAFLRLHAHAVVDLAAETLDRPFQVPRALLHPFVEVLQRAVEPLLGGAPLGDVLERAEDADDLAVEVAQRDLLGLDPAQIAAGPAQALDDPDHRLAGLGDVGVPVHEPVGAELGVVGPRHVAVGLADQVVGFGPGKGGEDTVAAEVTRLPVLPEHSVGRRVHQHLEQLLARLEGIVATHAPLQEGGVQFDVRADAGLGRHWWRTWVARPSPFRRDEPASVVPSAWCVAVTSPPVRRLVHPVQGRLERSCSMPPGSARRQSPSSTIVFG